MSGAGGVFVVADFKPERKARSSEPTRITPTWTTGGRNNQCHLRKDGKTYRDRIDAIDIFRFDLRDLR